MGQESPQFGSDDAKRAAEYLSEKLLEHGLVADDISDGLVLGSGLGNFTEAHMDKNAVKIPYGEIFQELKIGAADHGKVAGHAHELVIGPLKGTTDNSLVIAQSRVKNGILWAHAKDPF